MEKLNKRIIENAMKVAYLAKLHPEMNIVEVSQLFQTSPIEFNVAAWAAQDLEYFTVAPDNSIKLGDIPDDWDEFGELVGHLMVELPYAFGKLNAEEADMESEYLNQWTAGFPSQDVEIAIDLLKKQGIIASYEVKNKTEIRPNREQRRKGAKNEDIIDTYTFYTLPENLEKRWGEKQFDDPEKLQKEEA